MMMMMMMMINARVLECGFSAPLCSSALSSLTNIVEFVSKLNLSKFNLYSAQCQRETH